MNLRRGVIFALGSVLLVSAAQLALRWSMSRLPPPGPGLTEHLDTTALAVVLGAILAYALSMLSWLLALRDLPLGRAYSLLSISYALVYLLAAALPVFNEGFSLSKSLGVTLVILGVLVINSRPVQAAESRNVV
ncbi:MULTISPECIES: 4-amino-4-deoxy-L-arabinose-phosphoundecaprenol flippase subunit ArnF [Pseudomonas]|uniref:4-amino-4-deoxy-L-arabinose-phosphoundecaprenol flippase subunit ArnF n=1 Tax=Pseudomonas TaxID=286 RepID=UPI001BEB2B63|nr:MULTISPECIES: 4-amino-4-deoxy-L-arabinose-phosphoundecaprenol flippase subunit ArnF [Pseudomonas]MBT2341171.1 4-amino-4-deoxy-L-arabinose-phosphoundecaprenol flippase subunit ArnF [Pseudomonas fluorescens]MCD4531260.1 4-amino-4-deoxy-L-arabinose-phosphoundecaprenol flippase subunit ArnF [Pseudomonas sp. C3-2018]